MRPTRPAVLVLMALAVTAAMYGACELGSPRVATLAWYAPVTLLALGVAEAYAAFVTRERLRGRGRRPLEPVTVPRIVALAKASSVVAAFAFGAYAGLLAYLLASTAAAPGSDRTVAGVGAAGGLVLAAGALALETACRVRRPPGPDGGAPGPDSAQPGQPSARR